MGLRQSNTGKGAGAGSYARVTQDQLLQEGSTHVPGHIMGLLGAVGSLAFWKVPKLGLNLGQRECLSF